jgi:hypothetical protein
MAEGLLEVRMRRAYEAWGYDDFYRYCADELLIKRRTVDKLTGSYQTLQRHAPDALDSVQQLPSVDAVDYFNRALERSGMGEEEGWAPIQDNDAAPPIEQLRHAVFEEGRPISSLRREFHPVIFRKSDEEAELEVLEKANTTAQRLSRLLVEIPGLGRDRVAEVAAALEGLIGELEPMIEARRPETEARKAS